MIDVLVDARVLDRPPTGIGRYTRELIARLPEHGVRITALVGPKTEPPVGATGVVRALAPFLSPLEQLELPARVAAWRLRAGGRGVFWVPSYNAACLAPGRLVLTVHDANHLAFPELYGPAHRLYYRTVVRLACERSRAVLCVSEFSRREIVERLGVAPDRCRVALEGAAPITRPPAEEIARVRARRGLPPRYVLYVGNFKPHKNLGLLLASAQAFAQDVPLVLVGGREEELPALAAARERGAAVVVLPPAPDAELWPLMAGASVFAFPSRYEGFGLPPLEAMALDVPVVTTTAASLPEVVGNAALLVDPDDPAGFGSAIRRVLDDPPLAAELIARGRRRTTELTWDRCAVDTAAVLHEAAR